MQAKRKRYKERKINGGNDDYVSDETTQMVKHRDNALHLILYRTRFGIHLLIQGDFRSKHIQNVKLLNAIEMKEANISTVFSFRFV